MKYFSYKDFKLSELIKIKKIKGITVGLALPVYNESETISKTIKTILSCKGLIDELIVVDSNSFDDSVNICETAGIKVYKDIEATKKLKVKIQRGKGWNLWSSLYFLNTDIILWIDSDITNITQRFITGIAGPLICDDDLKFVKSYYKRPKSDARVTEIMVRPFTNLVFPELNEFIQPLSGEYGGRRNFLEKIFFFSGYSVEIAILIQAMNTLSPKEVGQSYLDKRVHKLQSVSSLGKMSAGILYTLLEFSKEYNRIKILSNVSNKLHQFIVKNGFKFIQENVKISDKRLPKMIEIKQYNKKFYGNSTSHR
jgi:glucosyl-3-phosphoglycerate synthase